MENQDFVAYMAPRLLGGSIEEEEMNRVCEFLEKHVVGGEKRRQKQKEEEGSDQAKVTTYGLIDRLEVSNKDAMLKFHTAS